MNISTGNTPIDVRMCVLQRDPSGHLPVHKLPE